MSFRDRQQAIVFLRYLGLKERSARRMAMQARRSPMAGYLVFLNMALAGRKTHAV